MAEANPEVPEMGNENEPLMGNENAEQPAAEEPAQEQPAAAAAAASASASEKAASERLSTRAPEEESEEERYCACCCCLCHCSDREYRDLSCCGCFPVKCGIYAIGILAVFLTVLIFAETFMMLMSEHIAWWYVLVSILLQIPLIIGLIFFLNFFGEDSDSTRGKLRAACILAIVSFGLQVAWNVGYFWGLYKQQNITIGNEEALGTFTTSKKMYLFWTTFFYLWASFAFGYFICVVGRYSYRLRNKEDETPKEDEENAKADASDEKK
jgi:heme/copper-type cytochrome/quinol oxidase subunit 4